jgi:hypothetical protein
MEFCVNDDELVIFPITDKAPIAEIKKLTALEKSRLREAKRAPRGPRPGDRHKYTNLAKLKKAIAQRMVEFQEDGLDAIWDLATMDEALWAKNSMLGQLKFQAARLLAFPDGVSAAPGDSLDATLRQLDAEFKQAAPRIKTVRERIVTFEGGERVIEGQPSVPSA